MTAITTRIKRTSRIYRARPPFFASAASAISFGNHTKKLMKKNAVNLLIMQMKTSGNSCGESVDLRRNPVFPTCAKACGIPVEDERISSGTMVEKQLHEDSRHCHVNCWKREYLSTI